MLVPSGNPIHVAYSESSNGGRYATVTMNFSGSLNILGAAEIQASIDTFQSLATDDELRAVILRGAGTRAFIGGANIHEMAPLDPGSARAFITHLHQMMDSMRKLPVPVIAQIQGYCLGGGMEVSAACDIRVATDDSVYGMPEVRVGIPSVIEAALLPYLIGWGKTRELLYTGAQYSAAQVDAWGFLERCVPVDQLESVTMEIVEGIVASGPRAIRTQKALMQKWEGASVDEAIQQGIEAFGDAYTTSEPADAMQSFLNRKKRT